MLKGIGFLSSPPTVVVQCTAFKEDVSHVFVKAGPKNQHCFAKRLTPVLGLSLGEYSPVSGLCFGLGGHRSVSELSLG
jgi:hypothetical protein